MSRGTHDNWERLVGAVLDREELRRIARADSLSSDISVDLSSRSSFGSIVASVFQKPLEFLAADFSGHGPQPMKFIEIQKSTKNFHQKRRLGEGVFGPVFKGWIDEHTLCASSRQSGIAVAVKKWKQGSQPVYQEYMNEISYSSQLRHPNLVKLIGHCSEEDSLILVYEFMPRGSLDSRLFGEWKRPLSWAKRIKVAIDAARALAFLHDLTTPVIHRFCQSSSILLDVEYNAKLSHFGLARDVPTGGTSHFATQVAGVHGPVAPEYAITGRFSEKSDVFGFGIVLLELLSGRRALDLSRPIEEQYLVEQVKQYFDDKTRMLQIIDTRLRGQYRGDEAYAAAKLACQCLSRSPEERPRMAEVVVALQQLECS